MKYLDALLRFFNQNDFTHKEDVAILISDIFEGNPNVGLDDFKRSVKKIRRDFFRINRLNRDDFSEIVYVLLNKTKKERPDEKRGLHAEEKVKILFLAANPRDTVRLRLDEEQRAIEHKILLAQKKDRIVIVNKSAVRVGDLQLYLNQEKPTIVHFSGHGSHEGRIILEDNSGKARPIPPPALARVFEILKDNIRCVVLNACFSHEQARAITQNIDCVIGMSSSISDKAAIAFASAFYLAIASERSIRNAFDQGINELMLWEIPEEHIPQLLTRSGVEPSKIFLLTC